MCTGTVQMCTAPILTLLVDPVGQILGLPQHAPSATLFVRPVSEFSAFTKSENTMTNKFSGAAHCRVRIPNHLLERLDSDAAERFGGSRTAAIVAAMEVLYSLEGSAQRRAFFAAEQRETLTLFAVLALLGKTASDADRRNIYRMCQTAAENDVEGPLRIAQFLDYDQPSTQVAAE